MPKKPTPPRPKKGFVCPNGCGDLEVVKTRRRASGVVSRRRKCPLCPFSITTEERPKAATPGPVQK